MVKIASKYFYFFDGETGAPIYPDDPVLDFKLVGSDRWVSKKPELISDEGPYQHCHSIDWVQLCTRQLRCDPESSEVQIRLHQTIEYNLGLYAGQVLLLRPCASRHFKQNDRDEDDLDSRSQVCCRIPFPLFRLQETCVVRFRAYDTSFDDFVENAQSFLDNVEVTATAVQTPPPPIATRGDAALAKTPLAPAFQPGTFSATTVQGSGELAGLVRNQLYLLEVRGLAGYILEGEVPQFLYTGCECNTELVFRFRPCGKYPSRSLIFVRQECSGIRWENAQVELQGRTLPIDQQGYLAIPRDMVGVAQLSRPGKVFNPSQIDLTASSNVVTVVTVADQMQLTAASSHQFVDDNNVPFPHRTLTAVLPSGDTVRIVTDNQGRFEAPVGSVVYAEDDLFGLATEPILVSGPSGE